MNFIKKYIFNILILIILIAVIIFLIEDNKKLKETLKGDKGYLKYSTAIIVNDI